MNVLVVTNNPAAGEKLEKLGLRVEFTKGNAKRSLLHARDLIIKGWHLAADPRGGYNKRYNPCHTVFLCDESVSDMGEDVLVLEKLAQFHDSPYRPDALYTDLELKDFQILDMSIALRTTEHLKNYMNELSYKKVREV